MAATVSSCIFCQKASNSTANNLLHFDERVVAFEDINPSAVLNGHREWPSMTFVSCHLEGAEDGLYKATKWHLLVIPKEHIPTVRNLQRRAEDYSLVSHMLEVGQTLLSQDSPRLKHRFGFHQPPMNSVNHLHLHCFALPYTPRWKFVKYLSLGSIGFIEAEKLLEKIKP